MQRSTTPDEYSTFVRGLVRKWRAGKITPRAFGTLINLVWRLRGNA